jgi:hypothetical protein
MDLQEVDLRKSSIKREHHPLLVFLFWKYKTEDEDLLAWWNGEPTTLGSLLQQR